jgi:alcohol dehydrogenase
MESFVSIRANPLTDAMAWSGIEAFADGFFAVWDGNEEAAVAGRSRLAYASFLSGVCLAQTGLGSVHGLASPLGAFFPIPHGMCCGTLVAEATAINVEALQQREPNSPSLAKYARVGQLLTGAAMRHPSKADGLITVVETLRQWTNRLPLAPLSSYGMIETDIPRVVANSRGSSMKTNPIVLTDDEISAIVSRRLY